MKLIFGLMLLLQTAACLDQVCRLNQSDICYAALGHKLNLLMMWDATEYETKIQKNNKDPKTDPVCKVKKGRIRDCDLYGHRTGVTVINGSLIINSVIREDSGKYTIKVSNPSGLQIFKGDLQVKVKGLDQVCRFNQSDICYAALGHKLNLLMTWDTTEYQTWIQKNNKDKSTDPGCKVKKGRMRKNDCDLYGHRTGVTVIDGSLIINSVIREDSGNYTITLQNPSGLQIFKGDLQVKVEAPIGSVEVSIICSSSGVMRASCSSDGDQILYSWTLNEAPLMDGNSSIDLNERTDGKISCRVKNHVSHGQKTVNVKPCPGPTTASVTPAIEKSSFKALQLPLIALGCAALILILLFIIAYCIYKKKQVKSTPAAAGCEDITYADISYKKKSEKKETESLPAADVEYVAIQHQKKRKKRKEKEEEVQYGEVMFTPKRSSAHPQPQEDCIYSQVHRC